MPIIKAVELTKIYESGVQTITVLDRVSLEVGAGECVVIHGQSGSGKTTLLSLLSGLDRPSSGQVVIEDRDITGLSEDELAPLRNRTIGFVFQSFHLIPSLTAFENVIFPAELCGDTEAESKGESLLREVGLWGRRDNLPYQLSGGEKQRIAIARALINNPRILFADEPTGNLDSTNSEAVLDLLFSFHNQRQMTLIMVTHATELTHQPDRIITLRDGRIVT